MNGLEINLECVMTTFNHGFSVFNVGWGINIDLGPQPTLNTSNPWLNLILKQQIILTKSGLYFIFCPIFLKVVMCVFNYILCFICELIQFLNAFFLLLNAFIFKFPQGSTTISIDLCFANIRFPEWMYHVSITPLHFLFTHLPPPFPSK